MPGDVIKSYLVELGFDVNSAQLQRFQGSLANAAGTVGRNTHQMVGDVLKFQIAATGAFASVSLGVLSYVDKLASSDQQMRLFAMRSFMTLTQARSVKMALDTLGASLDDVAWDKELHDRFVILIDDQKKLAAMLGPGYEKQLHDVRDLRFELSRLELKGEYFGMKFASDLLEKMGIGNGNLLDDLERLNQYVLQNMPRWSATLAGDVIPVLKDTWTLAKGVGDVVLEGAHAFQVLMGVLGGDDSLVTGTLSIKNLGRALSEMLEIERKVIVGATAGIYALRGVKDWIAKDAPGADSDYWFNKAGKEWDSMSQQGMATSAMDSRGVGRWTSPKLPHGAGVQGGDPGALAAQVSARTGIPADLILSQWQFETGNFTNRGATSLNNLAGIRIPGTTEYKSFASLDDFAGYYSGMLTDRKYGPLVAGSRTPEAFAHGLKSGGYFESSEADYAAGIRRYDTAMGGASARPISIGSIPVTIGGTNASPADIQAAVARGVAIGLGEQNTRNQIELGGVYP